MAVRNENLPKEIPPHLNRWNWGAFLLNWIWGLGNSTYIALLMFVPFLNLVMPFVLGAKGSQWAWQNTYWRDEAHFASVQKKWAIAGFVVWIGMLVLIAGLFFSLTGLMKSSEAYRLALKEIRSNSQVIEALGAPIKEGFLPSGSISVKNASGKADLVISLTGSKKSGKAYLKALKTAGKWEIYLLVVRVNGEEKTIVLKNTRNLPIPGAGQQARRTKSLKPLFAFG